MTSPNELTFCSLAAQAYSDAYAAHGDLSLLPTVFESALHLVIRKHLGLNCSLTTKLNLVRTLHTNDLYLAVACAEQTEEGWRRFDVTYHKYIRRVALSVSRTNDAGRELAENLFADLFIPDRSGHSRIASFDGQQSLATWLGVVIRRRALNQSLLKWNRIECIDRLANLVDDAALSKVEDAITRNRHEVIVRDCFKLTIESLNDRERLMLFLRYQEGLRVLEVAEVLGVHPSGVTRQINHICLKLQKRITSLLVLKYHLGPASIRECVHDILENPAHSILVFLTDSCGRGSDGERESVSKLG